MSEEKPLAPPPPKTDYGLISVDLIDDPARPMRSDLSRESVAELAASIKLVGIIEPLVVREQGERYEVIAGHRRLVAAEVASLPQVPCQVVSANDEQVEVLKIHENLYRLDVAPEQEAEHFDYLIKQLKLSPPRIAKLINKSTSYVEDRLNILNFAPALRDAMEAHQINFSVAKELHRLDDASKLKQYLHYAVVSGITSRVAKRWVDEHIAAQKARTEPPEPPSGQPPIQPEIEQHSRCIYCNQELKLMEANIVYIHDHCLSEAQEIHAQSVEPQPADPQRPVD